MAKENGNNNKGEHNTVSTDESDRHDTSNIRDDNRDKQTPTTGIDVSTGGNSEGYEESRTEVSQTPSEEKSVTGTDIVVADTGNDNPIIPKPRKDREIKTTTRAINDVTTRKTAILMIFTLLNAGIKDRETIKTMIRAHGLLHSNNKRGDDNLFTEYIRCAEDMQKEEYGHTVWMTAKIQTGFNEDWHEHLDTLTKRIRANEENKDYFQGWIRELKDSNAKTSEILALTAIVDQLDRTVTMLLKDRANVIESGPMMLKVKKYIDVVHEILESRGITIQKGDILPSGNVLDNIDGSPRHRLPKETEKREIYVSDEDKKQFKSAKHLKEIEQEMGIKILPEDDKK